MLSFLASIAVIGLFIRFIERVIDFDVFAEGGKWRELYICKCGKWATPYQMIHNVCEVCGSRVSKNQTRIAREKFSLRKFRPIELGK